MKLESKNTNWLTPLLRWLNGDTTRRDEQALETLAKQDEFLADAMEGYRSMPKANHTTVVTKLKADLRRRYDKRRRGTVFYLTRIAAVGLVVLVAWVVFRQFNESGGNNAGVAHVQPPEMMIQSEAQEMADVPATDTNPSIANYSLKKKIEPELSLSEEKTTRIVQPQRWDELVAAESKAEAPVTLGMLESVSASGAAAFKDSAVVLMETDDAIAAKPAAKETAPASAPPALATERSAVPYAKLDAAKTAGPPRLVSGKVTDDKGDPLIGVNVLVPGTAKGTITDVDGTFSIDAGGASNLRFNYVGYRSEEVPLGNSAYVEVRMDEGAAQLSEVTVTGLGASKKAKQESSPSPEPENGFKKLEKHLEKNLKYPEAAAQKRVEGEVILRFRVMPDGSLTDFDLVKPLGSGCDEEAERLLRTGPKWKPAGTAIYTVKFQL